MTKSHVGPTHTTWTNGKAEVPVVAKAEARKQNNKDQTQTNNAQEKQSPVAGRTMQCMSTTLILTQVQSTENPQLSRRIGRVSVMK